ncbi:MAG: hypothetical protein K2K51_04770, partial [Bacteroidales bacterium]|nr:hypothetical protein [Bacteroidales bacterium]
MEIGLVFSLVVIWAAFEWKSYDRIVVDEISRAAVAIEEEMIIQTSQEVAPPPPPPRPGGGVSGGGGGGGGMGAQAGR